MPKASEPAAAPNRDVAILAYDGLCIFEFGVAVEIFALDRPEMGPDWYRGFVAAEAPGPLAATGGVTVQAERGLDALARAGTVVIPGWNRTLPSPALLAALRAAHAGGACLLSICSGAFLLAAGGFLDGRRATTHWRYAADFAAACPQAEFAPDVLYVDEGRVMTSAGSSAGIDLCLHLVRRDFGAAAANTVARRLVAPVHREGDQRQFVQQPVPRDFEAGRLSGLIDHVRANLDRALTVAEMARIAGMSQRTFIRRFAEATGHAPGRWLAAERTSRARDLLESSDAPVEQIAAAVGYRDAAALRHNFRRQFGLSPAAHRRQFGRA